MNCSSARNRLLAAPDPAQVPESVAGHLNDCPPCRAWHRLLVQVEATVVATVVPASDGNVKRQLLAQFQAPPAAKPKAAPAREKSEPAPKPTPTVRPARPRVPVGERLARLWPLGLVAAAILVGVISWAMFGGKPEQPVVASLPPDPLLEKTVAAKVKLDTAPTPAARLEVLSGLAGTIHEEAQALALVTPGGEMASLATMYRQVVEVALVAQARALSPDERKATLEKYVQGLATTEQEANRLVNAGVPVGSDQPLRDIAATARLGKVELSRLMQGKASS